MKFKSKYRLMDYANKMIATNKDDRRLISSLSTACFNKAISDEKRIEVYNNVCVYHSTNYDISLARCKEVLGSFIKLI